MPRRLFAADVSQEDTFDRVTFIGLARNARRDPYRLSLLAHHVEPGETLRIVLPVLGGDVLATDRRLLELRAHLDVHGAWNVKEFVGFEVHRAWTHREIRDLVRVQRPVGDRHVEDVLAVSTDRGTDRIVVSRTPDVVLRDEEFRALREAILGPQAK